MRRINGGEVDLASFENSLVKYIANLYGLTEENSNKNNFYLRRKKNGFAPSKEEARLEILNYLSTIKKEGNPSIIKKNPLIFCLNKRYHKIGLKNGGEELRINFSKFKKKKKLEDVLKFDKEGKHIIIDCCKGKENKGTANNDYLNFNHDSYLYISGIAQKYTWYMNIALILEEVLNEETDLEIECGKCKSIYTIPNLFLKNKIYELAKKDKEVKELLAEYNLHPNASLTLTQL